LTGRALTRLDGELREASARNDTLLRAVHLDAKSPSIVILMKHSNQLAGAEFKFVLHRRLEVELNTVNIVRTGGARSRAIRHAASNSNGRRTGRSWARGSRNVVSPGGAGRGHIRINTGRRRKIRLAVVLPSGCGRSNGRNSSGSSGGGNSRGRIGEIARGAVGSRHRGLRIGRGCLGRNNGSGILEGILRRSVGA